MLSEDLFQTLVDKRRIRWIEYEIFAHTQTPPSHTKSQFGESHQKIWEILCLLVNTSSSHWPMFKQSVMLTHWCFI